MCNIGKAFNGWDKIGYQVLSSISRGPKVWKAGIKSRMTYDWQINVLGRRKQPSLCIST